MNTYNYPDTYDPNFQSKIYNKREFYYHRAPHIKEPKTYDEIKKYRDDICGRVRSPTDHQLLLQKIISPFTPYRGLLLFHNVGSGKTCAAIGIAENFKNQVKKYNTKIYILVQGPVIKETWKNELINCTGNTYFKSQNVINNNKLEIINERKRALKDAYQYYKIMSFTTFYNKVLGQKIIEKSTDSTSKYKLTDEGDVIRNIAIDKIENLDNTLIIVDEAHNLTGNERGLALKKVLDNSKNTKIILLTATPMKNFADDIVELLNFIRPANDQIKRDLIFTSDKNHLMQIKDGGIDYFKKMANGYISYYKGTNPLTFATQIDIGEIEKNLLYTKVIKCKAEQFQLETYKEVIRTTENDGLYKRASSVTNFVFPNIGDKKEFGLFGNEGIEKLINLLKYNRKELFDATLELLKQSKIDTKDLTVNNFLNENNKKNVVGKIFDEKYLKVFSSKFHDAWINMKNSKNTVFVYSNLVKTGVELYESVLVQNGFLEYNTSQDYKINDDTICYSCGINYSHHKSDKHQFYPATYITVTGSTDESDEHISDEKITIINNVYNNIENKEGKWIKVIIGSKVMNEGVTLENIGEIHILDVHYTLGRIFQIIGRGVRYCKHYKVMNEKNPFPEVKIYKYILGVSDVISIEEELYKKAEIKYLLIKQIETIAKEVAIDCPLNYNANTFLDDVQDVKDCKKHKCDDICNYINCRYKCYDPKLNMDYYDKHSNIYKKIQKSNLDYGTYTIEVAKAEIEFAKDKIKQMFKFKPVYLLDEIINYVKSSYTNQDKRDLFDEFYVYKALDFMLPINENDFNNFSDVIYDKYNKSGYLIYRKKYYIFQPFDQNEEIPMQYRSTYINELNSNITVYDYLQYILNNKINLDDKKNIRLVTNISKHFDTIYPKSYYNKKEFDIVAIIDEDPDDLFRLRKADTNIVNSKKKTTVPSLHGAVCLTNFDKEELTDILKKLNNNLDFTKLNKKNLCLTIKHELLKLEKYNKDNITYAMIPTNHTKYQFPYNIYDRFKFIINYLKENNIKHDCDKSKHKIEINSKDIDTKDIILKHFKKDGNKYVAIIE